MKLPDLLHVREREDVHIQVPAVVLIFNHRLKLAVLYDADPAMPDDRYTALEKHLHKRGYFLQVIVGSSTGEAVNAAHRTVK